MAVDLTALNNDYDLLLAFPLIEENIVATAKWFEGINPIGGVSDGVKRWSTSGYVERYQGSTSSFVPLEWSKVVFGNSFGIVDDADIGLTISLDGSNQTLLDAANGLLLRVNGTDVIKAYASGFAGVNTANPAYAWDVTGDINFTGTLYNNGSAVSLVTQTYVDAADTNLQSQITTLGTTDTSLQNQINTLGTTDTSLQTQITTLTSVIAQTSANFRGEWSSATTYQQYDQVLRNGIRYYSQISSNLNNDPASSPTEWSLFVNVFSGNVGIGTSNPQRELTVGDGTGSPNILLYAATSGNSRIEFGDPSDQDAGEIQYDHSTNHMNFSTNGVANQMVLDDNGNVGIGHSSPQAKLDVVGHISTSCTKKYNIVSGANTEYMYLGKLRNSGQTDGYAHIVVYNCIDHGQEFHSKLEVQINQRVGVFSGNAILYGSRNAPSGNDQNIDIICGGSNPEDPNANPIEYNDIFVYVKCNDYAQGIVEINHRNGMGWVKEQTSIGSSLPTTVTEIFDSSENIDFCVTDDGNVGIGTSAPNEKLTVEGHIEVLNSTGGGTANLRIRGTGSNTTSAAIAEIKAVPESTGAATSMTLHTRNSSGDINKHLTINSSGDFLFANDSASQDEAGFRVFSTGRINASDSTSPIIADKLTSDGEAIRIARDGSTVASLEAHGNDLAIIPTGNVGIGTSSPAAATLLHVQGVIGTTNGTAAAPTHSFYGDPDNGMYRSAVNELSFSTDGTQRLTIDSTGRVGIGTSDPAQPLHVLNSNGAAYGVFDSYREAQFGGGINIAHARGTQSSPDFLDTNDYLGLCSFGGWQGSGFARYAEVHALATQNHSATAGGTKLVLQTTENDTTTKQNRLVIDHDGKVGIGTSAPSGKLDVNTGVMSGDVKIGNFDNVSNGDNTSQFGEGTKLEFIADTNPRYPNHDPFTVAYVKAEYSGSGADTTSGDTDLVFATYDGFAGSANGVLSDKMRITAAGDVQISTGNLVIGTAGKGIDFSANSHATGMSSELLDDYEEGSFSPSYAPSSGSFASITYFRRTGYYTKIGNVVHVYIDISTNELSIGTASGNLHIEGLPFTVERNSTASMGAQSGWTTKAPDHGAVAAGSNKVFLRYLDQSTPNYVDITLSNLITGTNSDKNRLMGIAFTYRTSA